MITEVKITDNTNLPLTYSNNIAALSNGATFQFKNGINIIIGKNGCGKTTLLKNIANYLLCDNNLYSKLPNFNTFGEALKLDSLFDKDNKLKDGMNILCDYAGVVYNYIPNGETVNNNVLDSFENIGYYFQSKNTSTGERMKIDLYSLFSLAFKNKNIQFPIAEIKKHTEICNDYWKERFDCLIEYYKKNAINIRQEDFAYTFLIDEPDRNLDVTNIDELYNVLSYEKEMTQLICVIHNPILIYKLSQLDYINFIEMTNGYLDDIKSIFKNLRYDRKIASKRNIPH